MSRELEKKPGGSTLTQRTYEGPTGGTPGKRTLTEQLSPNPQMKRGAGGAPAARHSGSDAGQASPEPDTGARNADPKGTTLAEAGGAHLAQRVGVDATSVRVHEDGVAEGMGARAVTKGQDVHFAKGELQAPDADFLIGHELAHVVQQGAGTPQAQAKRVGGDDPSTLEAEADRVGIAVAGGASVAGTIEGRATAGSPQKKPVDDTYTVQSGETLVVIAAKLHTTVDALKAANADKLKNFPTKSGGTVQGFNAGEVIKSPATAKAETPATASTGKTTHGDGPGILEQGIEAVSSFARAAYHTVTSWFADEAEETKTPSASAKQSTYHNQRDNTFKAKAGVGELASGDSVEPDVKPGNECNVTSLAMQLQTLAGSEQRARTAACDLLEQKYKQTLRAGDRDSAQVEDLILRRFFIPDWADGTKWKELATAPTPPFYTGWWTEQVDTVNSKRFHEHPYCLAYVASEFSAFIKEVGALKISEVYSADHYKKRLKPVLDAGGSVLMGTFLTGKGHIVLLVAVDDDGIVINDPFGLALGKGTYLMNGDDTTAARKVFNEFPGATNVLARRAKVNPAHLTALNNDRATLPVNMGEHVYFNWAEVAAMNIGLWNNAVAKTAP